MEDFTSYSALAETSYETRSYEEKEDFFHAVFISGKNREDNGEIQKSGMMQIRNVINNQDEINMIITHTKQVLVKNRMDQNKKSILECFSFQSGELPWKGMTGNVCGTNSAERAASQFCNTCKAHIIAAGIHCDENGKPNVDNEGKPIFIFIRGNGMKYSGIADYLSQMSKLEDLEPIFKPVTEQSTHFEKTVVNNKRFVTKITVGEAESKYGISKVFKLEAGAVIPKDTVMKMLEISKKTMDKFIDKFDWSLNKKPKNKSSVFNNPPAKSEQQFSEENKVNKEESTTSETQQNFDFSNIEW